jgi:four helix bundle protein
MTPFPDPKGFTEWEATLPASFKSDPIWRTPAYRFGLWLSDLVKSDATVLRANRNMRNDAGQLLRAVGGISSNLSEGYSRTTGLERARYYEYALATTRESRDWYFKARLTLGDDVVAQRLEVLERIIRILTAIIPRERESKPRRQRGKTRDEESPRSDGQAT